MPLASLPIIVRASQPVRVIPTRKRPLTERRCSRLSRGSDPGLYLLATWAITCSNSCCDSGGSVHPMTPRSQATLPLVLCHRGCMTYTFSKFETP